ncbi:MAG: hypothetical protein Q8N36_05295, partial [bacterium]|nr:hypothetical protein [bacterium]
MKRLIILVVVVLLSFPFVALANSDVPNTEFAKGIVIAISEEEKAPSSEQTAFPIRTFKVEI